MNTWTQVAPDLWACEHLAHRLGIRFRYRMSVVRLPSGSLLLYSPVPLEDDDEERLRELGAVAHVLAPSCAHYLFAGAALQRFPEAVLWGAPGLAEKVPDLPLQGTLATGQAFEDAVVTRYIRGVPRLSEVVAFHPPSGSLLCCDFLFNIQDEPSLPSNLLYRVLGVWRRFVQSKAWRWFSQDREALGQDTHAVLEWPVRRVLMGHGDVLEVDEPQLREALAWGLSQWTGG